MQDIDPSGRQKDTPLRASYGVAYVNILENDDYVLMICDRIRPIYYILYAQQLCNY